ESLKSGWELLAICLYFFSPSPKFHPFLESYISKHRESQCNSDNIPSPEMSADCLRRLKRAQKIVSKTAVHKPTIEELEHAKATICCPTMFGNMLEDIMLLQKDRYPDRQLPWIQTVLSEEILRLHGTQTEGIFRVSGDMDEVNSMKTQCDKWILPTDCTDPHIPASLLKMWYRELFEPLIPAQFYQACVDNFSNPEAAIAIVYQLPRLNHLVLCYLIRFLQVFASPENVAFTKMDVNNLAMVMAPSCLRYESDDLLTIYEHVQKEMGFIRTLIRYLDTSFMEGIL
ncbi:unnamed protein product, partial [Candidula unifasciata]